MKFKLFLLLASVLLGLSTTYAICGDGKIDLDPNTQQPTEECDLGDANNIDENNPDPNLKDVSGCTKECRVRKDGGWKCTNTLQDWCEPGQTNPRSLKNLFIKLALQNYPSLSTDLATCKPTSTDKICTDYFTDLAEFKRLNLGNPINVTAQMKCELNDDSKSATTPIVEFVDPIVGNRYTVNCGQDVSSNPPVAATVLPTGTTSP